MKSLSMTALATVLILQSSSVLLAQPHDENDILLVGVADHADQFATGSINTITNDIEMPNRVYSVTLGTVDGSVGFFGDEGFFATSNSAALPSGYDTMPVGAVIHFDFKAFTIVGETANLWFWDPTANPHVDFHPPTNGLTVTYQKSPTSFFHATVDGGGADVAGFTIDQTGTGGFLHRHLNILALDSIPNMPIPQGVYLVSLALSYPGATAPPLYEVINGNMGPIGDAYVGAAVDFMNNLLCPGDVDGNFRVDLTDLTRLLAHFGTTSGATRADGDLDGDGDVDLSDLAALLAHFGSTCN